MGWLANIGDFMAVVTDEFQRICNEEPTCSGVPIQGGCQVQAQQQYNPPEFPMQDSQNVIPYYNQVRGEIEAQAQSMSQGNGRPVPVNPSLNR